MIYLDHAATTPVRQEVIDVITQTLKDCYGNPSSTYQMGQSAKHLLRQARMTLAELLHVSEESIFFTSGATESNNWAIRSQAYQARMLGYGDHLVVASVEHSAVLKYCQSLEAEGFKVSLVYPDTSGQYSVDAFLNQSTDQTIGWIAMAVNNEVGARLPIEAIGEAAREHGYWFHCDTVQLIGKYDIDFGKIPVTSFVATGHKFNAPKGVGFMVYQPFKPEMKLLPFIMGGGQERGMRSGTENLAYIVGMVEALRLRYHSLQDNIRQYEHLEALLYQQLEASKIDYEVNGDTSHKVPYITSIWIKNTPASQLLIQMDLAQICVSAGSACSAGSIQPSRILQSYHPHENTRWTESLRISFGYGSEDKDVEMFVKTLSEIIL